MVIIKGYDFLSEVLSVSFTVPIVQEGETEFICSSTL